MRFHKSRYIAGVVAALAIAVTTLQLIGNSPSFAASTVRINAGGSTQTVNGTTWSGCSATNACNGYVSGGFAWTQQPAPNVSGYPSNTNAAMHQSEWTGGSTNGVGVGQTAFTFSVPVESQNNYDVTLQFTELNKTAAGQRQFDVAIDGATMLASFDIYKEAGGAYKTITRTFRVRDTDGKLNIAFIRRVENAKVDAIEIVPSDGSTTPTTSPSTSSTSTPNSTTSTTYATPATGTNISWTQIANAPFRTAESNGGLVNNKIYVFGGFQPGSFHESKSQGAVYDINSNKWSSAPSLPYPLSHSGRAIDGDRIIFAGGVSWKNNAEVFAIPTVLTFDTNTNKWGYLPNLPQARGSVAAAIVGRTLHVFGGMDGTTTAKSDHWTLNLNNTGEGWKTSTPIPSARTHFAAVTVNDTDIYGIGGMTGWESTTVPKQDAYKFSTITGQWTRIADMPTPRSHTTEATMLIGARIWMFGGEPKYPNHTTEIDVYDLATNKWSKAKSSLPGERFAGIGGHIGNTVWYVNGTVYETPSWRGTIY